MKYPRLSPEDEKAFFHALSMIWDAVAVDCLKGEADNRGIESNGQCEAWERVTVPRSTVICIVTDQFAGGYNFNMPYDQFVRIRKWMLSTPNHIVDKVCKKEFKFSRYGA